MVEVHNNILQNKKIASLKGVEITWKIFSLKIDIENGMDQKKLVVMCDCVSSAGKLVWFVFV